MDIKLEKSPTLIHNRNGLDYYEYLLIQSKFQRNLMINRFIKCISCTIQIHEEINKNIRIGYNTHIKVHPLLKTTVQYAEKSLNPGYQKKLLLQNLAVSNNFLGGIHSCRKDSEIFHMSLDMLIHMII